MPVTWSDEKLILLYCPGRGSNSRPPAHRGFKHGQGVPRPYSLGHGGYVDYIIFLSKTGLARKTSLTRDADVWVKFWVFAHKSYLHLKC